MKLEIDHASTLPVHSISQLLTAFAKGQLLRSNFSRFPCTGVPSGVPFVFFHVKRTQPPDLYPIPLYQRLWHFIEKQIHHRLCLSYRKIIFDLKCLNQISLCSFAYSSKCNWAFDHDAWRTWRVFGRHIWNHALCMLINSNIDVWSKKYILYMRH